MDKYTQIDKKFGNIYVKNKDNQFENITRDTKFYNALKRLAQLEVESDNKDKVIDAMAQVILQINEIYIPYGQADYRLDTIQNVIKHFENKTKE